MKKALFSLFSVLPFLGACDDAKAPAGNPEAVAEAQKVWDTKCSTCHGKDGKGDGEAGKVLQPPPRNFQNSSWQADDARVRKVIVEGGAAVGLSANMAPNPELKDKPEVVEELLKKVKSFKP
jgi:mono/diheme cytochrome c family protein